MTFTEFALNEPINAAALNQRFTEVEALLGAGGVKGLGTTGDVVQIAGVSLPTGWLLCDGSAVSRSLYAALFAAIGTSFGVGDGSSTFNLPDLRGRVPIGAGTGSGLTARTRGQQVGAETHTLSEPELPAHTHTVPAVTLGGASGGVVTPGTLTQASATESTGSGAAHNNMQPSRVVNWIIKL